MPVSLSWSALVQLVADLKSLMSKNLDSRLTAAETKLNGLQAVDASGNVVDASGNVVDIDAVNARLNAIESALTELQAAVDAYTTPAQQ